jgi:LysM repeat protein
LYGSSIVAIQQANQLPNANAIIGIGDALIVPVALIVVTSTPTSAVAITFTPTSAVGITATATTVSATATPANNPQGEIIQYTVQAGDTLSGIARRFNTSVAAVAQLNGIVNPDRVLLGQTLQIPSAQVESAATPLPQSPVSTPQGNPDSTDLRGSAW